MTDEKRLSPGDAAELIARAANDARQARAHQTAAALQGLVAEVREVRVPTGICFVAHHGGTVNLIVDPSVEDGPREAIREVTIHVHRDKDSNYSLWEEWGLDPQSDAARRFAYTACEVPLRVRVNIETGESEILGVAGTNGLEA